MTSTPAWIVITAPADPQDVLQAALAAAGIAGAPALVNSGVIAMWHTRQAPGQADVTVHFQPGGDLLDPGSGSDAPDGYLLATFTAPDGGDEREARDACGRWLNEMAIWLAGHGLGWQWKCGDTPWFDPAGGERRLLDIWAAVEFAARYGEWPPVLDSDICTI